VESHRSARWLKPFPTVGYVASQAFILFTLFGVYTDAGLYSPLELSFSEAVWGFAFVVVPSLLPALITGAIAGASSLLWGTMWAVVGRLGATVLVLALGVVIAYLVALASFSIPQMPLSLGQFVGVMVGMKAALGISWGTSVLSGRIFERRQQVLGSRDHERRTTRE
jgi:fucose 4-O-acetylase-like acetyltransferase